ncbi:MAG: hypothetical protein HZB38_03415 [Planctomycetes bacterium]|nr:hypothetical protein [Planctomycetota bacterium]
MSELTISELRSIFPRHPVARAVKQKLRDFQKNGIRLAVNGYRTNAFCFGLGCLRAWPQPQSGRELQGTPSSYTPRNRGPPKRRSSMRTLPFVPAMSLLLLVPLTRADAVLYAVHAPPPNILPELDSLSSDGTAAAGWFHLNGGARVMRWTIANGSEALTGSDTGFAEGLGCSGAGRVVTAFGGLYAGQTGYRWTQATGWIVLPMPPDTWFIVPRAISEDGMAIASWVIGYPSGNVRPARWTESLGYEILHDVPADDAYPVVISGDGSTIVGQSYPRPFYWTQADGYTLIPVGTSLAIRFGVSHDGRFVVGSDEQSVWRFERVQQNLLRLQRSDGTPLRGYPRGVSGDGSIVVGKGSASAFIWDEAHGARDLAAVLTGEYGVDLSGWTLTEAIGISTDGNVIAGNGLLNGQQTSWVVALQTPVPYTGRPPCQGDVDGDHAVSLVDLALVLSEFRLPVEFARYDCTGDGVVDALDVDVVLHDQGQRCGRRLHIATP